MLIAMIVKINCRADMMEQCLNVSSRYTRTGGKAARSVQCFIRNEQLLEKNDCEIKEWLMMLWSDEIMKERRSMWQERGVR